MILDELRASPGLYPQKFDPEQNAVYFARITEAAYREASFLDERLQGTNSVWVPFVEVEQAMAGASAGLPLHFIFHTGHVGSTLLSRLIDEAGGVLGLREPLPLRTLAEMQDRGTAAMPRVLATFLKLWGRGFPGTGAVVLKATSSSGRIAPALLDASPASKAVYLNLKPEPYLATLLAGANALVDLKGFEDERMRRIALLLGAGLKPPGSIGELAAMSWLAESLSRARALDAAGERMLALDFDAMLADIGATLLRVLAHFDIAAPPSFAAAIARSPVLTRYSKAPQQFAYSPNMRAQLLAQARAEFSGEIVKGMRYLEQAAASYEKVAALL